MVCEIFFIFHAIQLAIQSLAPVLVFSFQRIFHTHITWNEAILHSHGSIVSLLFIMKIIYLLELQPEVIWLNCFMLSHLNRCSLGEKFGLYFIVNTYLD